MLNDAATASPVAADEHTLERMDDRPELRGLYARIASTYDDLPVRHDIPVEAALAGLAPGAAPQVLDVGCGTGLWLARHAALPCAPRLTGLDPSPEMLARARARLPAATLVAGAAEAMPFATAAFDFVSLRFCHHHLRDRARAFAEVARVLRPGGHLLLVNIDPRRMPGHWIFRRFPEARALDVRYPDEATLLAELAAVGLPARVEVRHGVGDIALAAALDQARRRDQSHLAMLPAAAYEGGLAALSADAAADPEARCPSESFVLTLRAVREGRHDPEPCGNSGG